MVHFTKHETMHLTAVATCVYTVCVYMYCHCVCGYVYVRSIKNVFCEWYVCVIWQQYTYTYVHMMVYSHMTCKCMMYSILCDFSLLCIVRVSVEW